MKKYNFDKVVDRKGTGSVKYDMVKMLFGNEDILPMWVADMDFEVPDFITDAVKRRAEHPVYGYTLRTPRFYESAAGWQERRHGWKVDPDHVDFSPGVVPALVMAVLAYTNPGDKILVQSPVYFPFFNSIENHGRVLVNNQLTDNEGVYSINFDDLEAKFKDGVKMMMFCHPHNPVGRVWTEDELQLLAELVVKYNVLIISDEVHSDLLLFGNKHIPLAMINREVADNTITCVAPSKTFNLAGMHTSAIIIENPDLRKEYKRMLDHIHVGGGSLFGFTALEAAYEHGDDWVDQLLKYLEGNYLFLKERLKDSFPQVRVSPLEATYLAWLNFEFLNMDDDALMKFMTTKAKLGFINGSRFGEGGQQYMRMNIAVPRVTLERATDQLIEALTKEVK